MWKNCVFLAVFHIFHHVNLILKKNNKSLEHLNILLHIFLVSSVFQNFEVDFWPLLKAEKVLPPSRFWRENFISLNLIFYHPYESINF